MDQLKACINVIEEYGGTPGAHPGITKVVLTEIPRVDMTKYPSGVTSDQANTARKTDRERYLACLLISGACIVIYGDMKIDFYNEYLKDKDSYPKAFEAALKYMNDYQMLKKTGRYKKSHRKNE